MLVCEDKNASAVKTVADMAKADIVSVYEILYVKNGKAVAEYKCYVAADDAQAKKIADTYQMPDGLHGDVMILCNDKAMLDQMMDIGVKYGYISAATPEAYIHYLMSTEGFKEYEGDGGSAPLPDPKPVPGPGPDPTPDPAPGPPVEEFVPDFKEIPTVQITKDYSFTDPDGLDYAVRFGAYGGPESGAFGMVAGATQADIKEMYEVLYVKDGRPAAEYKCYVTANEAEAQKILTAYGTMVSTEHDVAIMYSSGENVEQTIAMYAQYGGLTDPTPAGYLQFMIDNENLKPVVPPEAPAPVRSAGDQEADEGQKEKALQEAAEPEAEAEPKTGAEPEAEAEAAQPAAQTEEEEPVSKVPAAALLETAEDVARKADREEDDEPAEEEEPVHEDEPEQTEEPKQQEGPAAEEGAGPGEGLDEA